MSLIDESSLTYTILVGALGSIAGAILISYYQNLLRLINKFVSTSQLLAFLSGHLVFIFINLTFISIFFHTNKILWIGFQSIYLIIIWYYLFRLEKNGVCGADETIENGIDYNRTLKLITQDFRFIGVGASKLTKSREAFAEAVRRVNSKNGKFRLILCDPNSEALKLLAKNAQTKQNGIKEESFQRNVSSSQETLKELVKDFNLNIEVKLYNADQIFRMPMFRLSLINNDFCLVSYSLFNDPSHQGEQLAQLHLKEKYNANGYDVSLYSGFEKYFDHLWESIPDSQILELKE